jgi:hypothetical protein
LGFGWPYFNKEQNMSIIEKEISGNKVSGQLRFVYGGEDYDLHRAVSFPNFAGFKYADGSIWAIPWTSGFSGETSSVRVDNRDIVHATHVLFRR